MRRELSSVIALLMLCLVTGCASLPTNYPPPPHSVALEPDPTTPLGRHAADVGIVAGAATPETVDRGGVALSRSTAAKRFEASSRSRPRSRNRAAGRCRARASPGPRHSTAYGRASLGPIPSS